MSAFDHERTVGLYAVTQAMAICRRVQASITDEVLEKSDRSPVTIADFASQAIICRELGIEFPNDPIIGEEDAGELRDGAQVEFLERIVSEVKSVGIIASGNEVCDWIDRGNAGESSDRFWTLDPIDGTKGFLRGEQYAISLALIVEGEIQVALLGCPNLSKDGGDCIGDPNATGTIFFAVKGTGAYAATPGPNPNIQPIHARDLHDVKHARLCESVESGHTKQGQSAEIAKLLNLEEPPVRLDSQAKYATVARGEAEIYLRLPTRKNYHEKIWDHAGGVLLVEEAGGRVTDANGEPLEFTHGSTLANNQGVIATNGPIHDAVLEAYQRSLETS